MNAIAAVSAALNLITELLPQIHSAIASGQISDADQQTLQDAIANIEALGFSGPEWIPSGRS